MTSLISLMIRACIVKYTPFHIFPSQGFLIRSALHLHFSGSVTLDLGTCQLQSWSTHYNVDLHYFNPIIFSFWYINFIRLIRNLFSFLLGNNCKTCTPFSSTKNGVSPVMNMFMYWTNPLTNDQKINISGKENIYFLQNIQAYKALYNHLKEMEEQLIWTYDITWQFTLNTSNIVYHWKQGTIKFHKIIGLSV